MAQAETTVIVTIVDEVSSKVATSTPVVEPSTWDTLIGMIKSLLTIF